MKTQAYQPIPPTPKEYWEDERWADEHINEIVKDHPNQWVAVVNKKVVAAAKTIAEVIRIAEEKTGAKNFPILFVEEGIHVYQNHLNLPN